MSHTVKELKASGKFAKLSAAKKRMLEEDWQREHQAGTSSADLLVNAVPPSAEVAVVDNAPVLEVSEETEETSYILEDDDDIPEDHNTFDGNVATDERKKMTFPEGLRRWALASKISLAHVNDLLLLVRDTTDYYVPKDARTFLNTPTRVGSQIATVAGGQLWYQGIETALQNYFSNTKPTIDRLEINLSMDGIPVYNNGPTQLWPILMQLHNISGTPVLVIGVFCGSSKPNNCEDYLRPLVTELNQLLESGFKIGGKQYHVNLRLIVADSPARAFIKGAAYFNAIHGCMKCKCVGVHVKDARKVIFENSEAEKRTDAEFRSGLYAAHYKRPSPLIEIKNFNIVENVIVGDRLHLIDLGVTKKLLKGWSHGGLEPFTKWSSKECDRINKLFKLIEFPSEITDRTLRPLHYLHYWKGTEYRTFLHYASLAILSDFLNEGAFHHFKLYFCAVTFLSSNYYSQYWEYAGSLLKTFVNQFGTIYSRNHLTSNIHNLIHVSEEVDRFGPLHTFSTYPFENHLQIIKGLIRSGSKTLQQVICRLGERKECNVAAEETLESYPKLKIKNSEVICYVRNGFVLKTGNKDSWFLTKSNHIMQYSSATTEASNIIKIEGHVLPNHIPAFSYPCCANLINTFRATMDNLVASTVTINLTEIKCKLVAARTSKQTEFIFTPLLHTLGWEEL
ncbi:uncharacterized protein LOC118513892 [Anopheles stephensi]|uniref:uncharacterized protein LOC118502516 n=1 Tax=Anopheles stephensi TaxID=30069 RepID=UPI001658B389|nr:uncharacterized protein LOC118502516 [Anopheles stephensi]XP_035897784.1 uncharacterized protein LOC118505714 [Anopheles stephensi]XP_035915127.1 uncharacterized protein LOC118513460 [Anopheles stephensi]XP_035916099.1 uncharacterized protein LOC118513892 [Anopheles stephensi]